MKIAFVIPGRFHGFDLARALLARGHALTVFTNYPRWAARRFGLPDRHVRSFVLHGALGRVASRLPRRAARLAEAPVHRLFGRWAARALAAEEWDVIHCWSGVSEELLRSAKVRRRASLLMRGSAHIVAQSRLLEDEEARAGTPLDRPSAWMIAREEREYQLADGIRVLSTFALESFVSHGVARDRLILVPPGVDAAAFRPPDERLAARLRRILSGAPLRVLYVGAVSYRKGILDLADAVDRLDARSVSVTVVGPVLSEARPVVDRLRGRVTFADKVPQHRLPERYWDADVFVFPTIEDGFGVVLAQARAAGLPIVTTAHSAGADLVTDGVDGWLVPIRDGAALAARLEAIAADRTALASVARHTTSARPARDWARAAEDLEAACERLMSRSGRGESE
jgi:glycosyltransferase involved in cell wall biosynthesis